MKHLKAIILIISVMGFSTVKAHDFYDFNKLGTWITYSTDLRISDRLSANFDNLHRFNGVFNNHYSTTNRIGATFHFNLKNQFSSGMASNTIQRDLLLGNVYRFNHSKDIRAWSDYQYKTHIKSLEITTGIRGEYRAIKPFFAHEYNSWKYRIRQRINASVPILLKKSGKEFKLTFGNEIFFEGEAKNDWSMLRYMENRSFAAIEYDLSNSVQVSLGYLRLQEYAGENNLFFSFRFTPDLREN